MEIHSIGWPSRRGVDHCYLPTITPEEYIVEESRTQMEGIVYSAGRRDCSFERKKLSNLTGKEDAWGREKKRTDFP